ncbi:MAG: cation diffusion facilitator family transporter [Gammaproteobacteria bacterium]|nr:cation diffusion facilitator family transporter [Gammaproteobacteria bacterium]
MLSRAERDRKVRVVLILEGSANVVVLIAKTVVGIYTGSSAILSDALHSLTDVFNNVFAYIALRISASPPDKNHPYGHRKFETLAVFVLATLLSVIAIEIVIRAYERIGNPILPSRWGLAVMFGVLLVNIAISSWEYYQAKRLNSDLLKADSKHTFSDVLTTIAVIAGWQLATHGYPIFDFILAVFVSAFVFYLAYQLFRKSIPILVDEAAVDQAKIAESIEQLDDVIKIERLRSRNIGQETFADVVVTVRPNMSTEESHNVADLIEEELYNNFGIDDVVVHVEPMRV